MPESAVPRSIFLVEDQALISLREKMELEQYGYTVTCVTTGEAAVEAVLKDPGKYDVLLMDIDLGAGIDGPAAAEKILREVDIPIVFLSSHTEPEIVGKTEKITSYGYVVKDSGIIVLDVSIKMAFKLFRAKQDVLLSEQRFSSAAELGRTFTWEVDMAGLYTYIHPAIEKICGFLPDDLVGKLHFYDLTPEKEREAVKEGAFSIMESGRNFSRMETVARNKDGGVFWALVSGMPIYDREGALSGYRGSTTDITEKKLMEIALRENEERLHATLLSIGDAVITCSKDGLITELNHVAETLTGWSSGEAQGLPIDKVFQIINADTREPASNPVVKSLREGVIVELANHTILISREGAEYQIADSCAPIKDEHEYILGCVLVFRDVTEEYRSRKALRESEKRYRLLADNSSDMIWTILGPDENFRMTYVNPAVKDMLGYSPEEFLKIPIQKQMTAKSMEVIHKSVDKVRATKRPDKIMVQHVHKDGHFVDVEILAKPVFDSSGRIKSFYGRTIDISRQVAMMKELETARKLFESVILQSPIPMAAAAPDGRLLIYNDACMEQLGMTGVDPGESFLDIAQVWEDYDSSGNQINISDMPLARALAGEAVKDMEVRVVRADGTERWELVSGTPVFNQDGEIIAGLIIFPDITGLKQSELQILESERRFRQYTESAPMGVFLADGKGRYLDVNPAAVRITGFSAEELKKMSISDLLPDSEDPKKKAAEQFARVVQEGFSSGENIIRHKSGEIRYCTISAVRLSLDRFMGYLQDITGRVIMEKALRDSRGKLEMVIDSVPALIWQKDAECLFTMVNRRFCDTINKTREEILGRGEFDLFPEEAAQRFVNDDRRVMETGSPLYGIVESHSRDDGGTGWTRTDKFPYFDSSGIISGTIGFALDITESKMYEQEIETQLHEKDIILKEVHHRIKNNLFSIKTLLEMQKSRAGDGEAKSVLNEAIVRMESMLHIYKRLLLSEEYGVLNVREYLTDLIDSILKIFPDSRRITLNGNIEEFMLSVKKVIPLGTIVNELLTNAMKYAFSGRDSGRLDVSLTREGDEFILAVMDDGPGLADSGSAGSAQGFGLALIEMLAGQLQGVFSKENTPDGLRCILKAPCE